MKEYKITKSSQVDNTLPLHIRESYKTFVNFMTSAGESDERQGFSQDILQNLLEYRDFDTYKNNIIETNTLFVEIDEDDDVLTLQSGYGFPEENGIILIEDEIILYRERTGNQLTGLQRGSSGTKVLATYKSSGDYSTTVAKAHKAGVEVKNLSSLFLVSMLETIHSSFFPGVSSTNVFEDINRSSMLQNIRDFFQSKGTKLGIKSLFKILFGTSEVEVRYPGDQMIKNSTSTWNESYKIRTVAVPPLFVDIEKVNDYLQPDNLVSLELELRSYNEDGVFARTVCETSEIYSEGVYELQITKNLTQGEFIANPRSPLTRKVLTGGQSSFDIDETTVTVESTLGFPESGFIFIDNEKISYESKTLNQFLNCTRAVLGDDDIHHVGTYVYGPYYIHAETTDDLENKLVSNSWPLGLVESVEVRDGGLLHEKDDEVFINGAGRVDPRDPIMSSFIENTTDTLASSASTDVGFIGNLTYGVSGVYFDKKHAYVASSNLPDYPIGPFSTDGSIGPDLKPINAIHVIPRRDEIQPNVDVYDKGTGTIGVMADGVPAFSNSTPTTYVHGKIARFDVIAQGDNYINPTVIITPNDSAAQAVVDKGRIVAVNLSTTGLHTEHPDVRISSGEDAVLQPILDPYGRLIEVRVIDGGRFYIDAPFLKLTDYSGKGKGAVARCVVSNGIITSVNIIHKGIDYDKVATEVIVVPIGTGAEVTATVQHYRFDRYETVRRTNNWTYDAGDGFIFKDTDNDKNTRFGYVSAPSKLMEKIGDEFRDDEDSDTTHHSKILGWAWDGNPIYGPYGYENQVDDSSGMARMRSGYSVHGSRNADIPSGHRPGEEELAFAPPSEIEFPLGVFVEDYFFDPDKKEEFVLNTELDEDIQTNPTAVAQSKDILATLGDDSILDDLIQLDENNGRICNTPEYPKELYPDGVYCYFITLDKFGNPEFPYIIGTTFHNRPITQDINDVTDNEPVALGKFNTATSDYEKGKLILDFNEVERHRNKYLSSTRDSVKLALGDISTGSVNDVKIEVAAPDTTKVGDYLYINNDETSGSGAAGIVRFVEGEEIDGAYGTLIVTRTISHLQGLDLSSNISDTYVFVEGSFIETSSGAQARVESYDTTTKYLIVRVITPNLILNDDVFYDNRGTRVVLPGVIKRYENVDAQYITEADGDDVMSANGLDLITEQSPRYANTRIMANFAEPRNRPDGSPLESGDMWWSPQNGRLYVYYINVTSMWVTAQPLGMIPLNGASDAQMGATSTSNVNVPHLAVDNTITISNIAPDERPNGTPNILGDLWWSPHTGCLYIWYSDYLEYSLDYYQDNGQLPDSFPGDLTVQWVIADPAGQKPTAAALDISGPPVGGALPFAGSVYSGEVTSIVAATAPTELSPGVPVPMGTLWWCTTNGKMFIKYDDGNTVQWVITTPANSATGLEGSLDEIISDGGQGGGNNGGGGGIITPEYEPGSQDIIWFENLKHFLPEDIIEFQTGTPGFDQLNEDAKIKNLLVPHSAEVIRGYLGDAKIDLPNGTITTNVTRALFTIETKTPHGLREGDQITVSGSSYPEVNGVHTLIEAGTVIPATGTVTIDPLYESVVSVDITYGGVGYLNDFYVLFSGGGGVGALGFATVSPFVGGEGGEVLKVDMINGGVNYTSAPDILFAGGVPNTSMSFYVSQYYPLDTNVVTYSGNGEACQNNPAVISMISPGIGYKSLPKIEGLVKRELDQAETTVKLIGTSISAVKILRGGNRYKNPKAIFDDLLGSGTGATARVDVNDGVVTNITITNSGSGYVEPVVHLVEQDSTIVALTDDIGVVRSIDVINPGITISADRSLKPEIQIETRVVVSFLPNSTDSFEAGQTVYQGAFVPGAPDVVTVTAYVDDYDEERQILTLKRIEGNLSMDEPIFNDLGTIASLLVEGQCDAAIVVSGASEPAGVFLDKTSHVSDSYAVIQDSYYYQWFSYVISSPRFHHLSMKHLSETWFTQLDLHYSTNRLSLKHLMMQI